MEKQAVTGSHLQWVMTTPHAAPRWFLAASPLDLTKGQRTEGKNLCLVHKYSLFASAGTFFLNKVQLYILIKANNKGSKICLSQTKKDTDKQLIMMKKTSCKSLLLL